MTLQTLAERLKRNVVVVDDLAGAVESYLLTLGFRVAAWVAVIPTLILTSRTVGGRDGRRRSDGVKRGPGIGGPGDGKPVDSRGRLEPGQSEE